MRSYANAIYRFAIESNGLKYRDVAEKIGITGTSLAIWMREEMNPVRKMRVEKAINELLEEKGKENG